MRALGTARLRDYLQAVAEATPIPAAPNEVTPERLQAAVRDLLAGL